MTNDELMIDVDWLGQRSCRHSEFVILSSFFRHSSFRSFLVAAFGFVAKVFRTVCLVAWFANVSLASEAAFVADCSGLFWCENLLRGNRTAPTSDEPPRDDAAYPNHRELLVYKDQHGAVRPVTSPLDWALRRRDILAGIEQVMGKLPDPSRRIPLDVQVLDETDAGGYLRRRISFAAEPSDRVPAYLLVPKGLQSKAPAMLCLHQTIPIGKGSPAGLGDQATLHYAHELASRGYVCLVPDYPSFGDYAYDFAAHRDRYASGSMKAIWNNLRAVDVLETLPEVDHDRIGCIGHSLGGHNTLFTAVFDQRLRAMVTSCGFTAFHHYYEGNLTGWTSDRYMPRIRDVYEKDPDRMPFDFYEVIAALAPRPLFISAPLRDSNFDVEGVRKVVAGAGEVYRLLGAEENLHVVYPDVLHDFPDDVRAQVYTWLDQWLKEHWTE